MSQFGYVLFLLLNAILFLRPGDLFEELSGVPFYEITILACLVVLAPQVLRQFLPETLAAQPITLCVLGILPATLLSHLMQRGAESAVDSSWMFLKVLLSYMLLVGAVNTPARLRFYLFWLSGCLICLTTLALLQHHEIIDFPALAPHIDRVGSEKEDNVTYVARLAGMGIFGNPNDLGRMLVAGIILGMYFSINARSICTRILWVIPISMYIQALMLTHSRGALLGLTASLVILLQQWVGGVRSAILGAVGILLLLVLFDGGRQTEISTSEGTGQQRIQLWSDGFEAVRSSPVFGIGVDTYQEHTGGLGAHNSFVHAYVEMGFFGGTLFFAAFYLGISQLVQAHRRPRERTEPSLESMRPFLVAILAGYIVGMFSSSRCYAIPTYMLLGLATVYLRLAEQRVAVPRFRMRGGLALRLTGLSACFVIALQVFISLFVNWGAGK